jgi:tetratricopeptide (TPR) repeat protein
LELSKTALNGKIPSEAAIYLALADAAEGQADRAQTVLEKLLSTSRKAKADVRVALGTIYWQRGALDKARSQFEDAVNESDDYEGSCALGRLLLALGSPQAAIEPLTKAVARNLWHGEAHRALGRAYLELGKVQEALALFHAWRAQQPGSADAHKSWALALYHAGQLKESDAAIGQALHLEGSDGEGHRIYAAVLFATGELASAFKELGRASSLRPHDPEIWCDLGGAYARQGKSESAAKAYQAARRENEHAYCGRIGAYASLPSGGRTGAKELIEMAQKAPEVWNKALALSTASRLMLASGAARDAAKLAEQSVATLPRSAEAHLALGLVEMRLKDQAKAREQLERAVELQPGYAAAHLALADLLISDDQTRSLAIEHYRAFQRTAGAAPELQRVKRILANLKRKVALR